MSRGQRVILALLVASIFLNYVDRGSLSIAAPLLEKELSLSPLQLGHLLGAFFWTYALCQLFGLAGWLADRFPVGIALAAGLAVWSAATVATGLVSGFAAIFAARLVLGAGESIAYPCYSRILAEDYPQHARGLANALLDAGSKLGPALGTFLGGVLLARSGWRVFFIALGAASLVWLIPWLKWMPRSYAAQPTAAGGPTLFRILKTPTAWGAFLAHFCGNYFWFFLLTWLPSYLVKERGYSIEGMATVGSIAYLTIAAATVCAGWLSDRLIRGGADATCVRRSIVCGGLAGSTIILPVAIVESRPAALALLLASCAAFGVYTSNHWAITQTLAGPRAAGRWTSLQNGVGNLSGIAAAWLTGALVQSTGRFWPAFVTAAVVALAGAGLWRVTVRELREMEWEESAS